MSKICFITTISMTLEAFVFPTAERLIDEGNEVYFVCAENKDFINKIPKGVKYIPIKMNRGVSLDGLKVIREFRKIFKEYKFDMVQYSTPNASLYASIAAKKEKIPVRLFGQWGIRYVGFSGIKRFIFKFLEKITCKNSTFIWSVSPKNRQFSIDEGLYTENKSTVLSSGGTIGIDLSNYDITKKEQYREEKRKELNLTDDYFVFGFVGRLTIDKGSNELLYAFNKFNSIYPNSRLLVIGRSEFNKGEIRDESLLKNPSIIFTGEKPHDEVKEYLSCMDIYVHPSYREGFGLVIQEAGAMGLPIITTDINGAGEVMENGISCLLVKPRDNESLFEGMSKLYDDKKLCLDFGKNARLRVEQKFDRNIMLNNQLIFYKELTKKC